jgi:hypothetical protein
MFETTNCGNPNDVRASISPRIPVVTTFASLATLLVKLAPVVMSPWHHPRIGHQRTTIGRQPMFDVVLFIGKSSEKRDVSGWNT